MTHEEGLLLELRDCQREILRRLDRLETRLTADQATLEPSDAAILAALYSSLHRQRFLASDVVRYAESLGSSLLPTLRQYSADKPQRLGCVLRRLEGRRIAGAVLRRVGGTGGRVRWRFCGGDKVGLSQLKPTSALDADTHSRQSDDGET